MLTSQESFPAGNVLRILPAVLILFPNSVVQEALPRVGSSEGKRLMLHWVSRVAVE